MNFNDHDIFIRPAAVAEPHGLVLVDDLSSDAVTRMRADACMPALVVQTSRENHQAWVCIEPHPSPQVRTAVARILARRYHADANSADSRHYGRLAGFSNRKPARRGSRRPPWVLLCSCDGHPAAASSDLIEQANRSLGEVVCQFHRDPLLAATSRLSQRRAEQIYRTEVLRLHATYGGRIDWSRADWTAARCLAVAGCTKEQIAETIRRQSPFLAQRKRGHEVDYINRTAEKVISLFRSQPHRSR